MGQDASFDHVRLERYLRALAHANRLELLQLLRAPRGLSDVKLAPRGARPGENPERAIARQSVQEHLDKLLEVDFVVPLEPNAERRGKEFVVNRQRLYLVAEEIRRLASFPDEGPVGRDETVATARPHAPVRRAGHALVLVHGADEGRVYALDPAQLDGARGWVVGRKPGLAVSLEYDPFVSLENAEIVVGRDGLELLDLRSSKNGTFLNWQRLGIEERASLRPGDVIGVGRSLLVYQSA